MYCKFCGEKIDDNVAFCSKCGQNLTGEPMRQPLKENVTFSVKEKIMRIINIIIYATIYFIAIITFIYLVVFGGGIVPAVIILLVTILVLC